jgi:hypothetical protein
VVTESRTFVRDVLVAQIVLAQQPTPILPDPKVTPGDAFEVTVQDLCLKLRPQKS